MGFKPVDQHPDFPALERRVLARWREREVFTRSLAARADGPLFRFFEGPPTANGRPGVHHVEARVFKDLFPRFRTMKGDRAPRKGGWDCHGIPVELEVERELGFTRKGQIEEFGVARFNARCRESVTRYVDDWERLTERIGFWIDTSDAYWTMSETYVDSVWWSLKQLWDDGLVYEDHKVVPYCPRCGTALSDHEVAQGYAETVDPSVYVRLPVTEGPLAEQGASLLVWTTTPWTLISHTAVAVGPDIDYVLARAAGDDYPVVVAADLVGAALGEDAAVLRDLSVDELRGLHYRPPFTLVEPEPALGAEAVDWHYVIVADFVTTAEGTGLVHLAPAFGEDDLRAARAHGLPVVNPVDAEGNFDARVGAFAGRFVKAADPAIVEDLRARGLLLAAGDYRHTYPFCWRCGTPLLYYAKPSWYIATTRLRDRLLAENARVDWHPGHIRDGRYGDWLAHNVDWALSRERYWGTPLPLWRCEDCGTVTAVGSRAQLGELAGRDLSALDPHRPFVDEIGFACPACAGSARRVPEVIDAWYDSGAMPFAQFGYPHLAGSVEQFEAYFPADFIAEGIDQTRGWFYSLMAVSTLLFDRNSYRSVLCLGHIVDAEGRKMSKSLGNVLDPWDLIDSRGADALRWLLLTDGSPWTARRVGSEPLDEVVRQFLLTLWNTYYFFVTYARIDGWTPEGTQAPPLGERPVMDRWVLAELADTVRVVDQSLEGYDTATAGRRLAGFVDDLSNWYVRRSRSRFWAPAAGMAQAPAGGDKDAAFATLHECLVTLSALLAPFVPFLADELYDNLVAAVDRGAPDSVHLLDFPAPDPDAAADDLRTAMGAARRIVELGRRARSEARVPVRQPLRAALVTLPTADQARWGEVAAVVAAELNVRALELPDSTGGLVTVVLKPNYRALGPAFGARTPAVARAIEAADAERVAAALEADGSAPVDVAGEPVRVTADQVQVLEEPRSGWQVVADGPYSVALDLAVDAALRREGLARELVRTVNELRKRLGFALDDRVRVELEVDGELAATVDEHAETIAAEVLAVELRRGAAVDGESVEVGGQDLRVRLERV
ncbi:MAG TPA: isoleucine--tRNA ligase [Egibacteraceae bacterium]|nr:isoleucine--tRNA ligase [Egibacteraceae bacterium]